MRSVSKSQAQAVAEKIRARLGALYHLPKVEKDGRGRIVEHRCTASIGIAMFRGLDIPASDILRAADTAMYRSKSDRCNGIYFSS